MLTAGGRLQHKYLSVADSFLKDHFPNLLSNSRSSYRELETALWEFMQSDSAHAEIARLCLRCWISHTIVYACKQLANAFGETYSFAANDLLPLVLDDDGDLNPEYQSVSLKILESFDPSRTALKTWSTRMVKNNPDINQFLLWQGLYRVTPWAILNDTNVAGLRRSLPYLSSSEIKQAGQLLNAYHRVYRNDRMSMQTSRSQRCATPSDKQLQRIDPSQPPNVVLSQLYDLAEQLRQARIVARNGPIKTAVDIAEHPELPTPMSDESEKIQSVFLAKYRQDFIDTLTEAIQVTIENYTTRYQKRKSPQGDLYHQALKLFHCEGRSMREIAEILGLTNQVKVTRLLQLKSFRAQVSIYWFNQLKEKVHNEALHHLSVEQLGHIAKQLDGILNAEIEEVMSEAAAEAQTPKDRSTNSIFAKCLCKVLSTMPKPEHP
ncbi:hypothetical protein [Leptothoe sp. PORK10 BA2]|uniref:hypothetical protein n=1 Tax=Leptothoe sp. PORK10 BA2 TaxID=3110254 RepID=UPI002B1FFE12|nr:hypothetical protein [Leptothoe sp. PORK10 BA2]MEA5464501.1 hypothetical protein [Leptothoe sp. PORK10 BA2]